MNLLSFHYQPHDHLSLGEGVISSKKLIKRKCILAVDQNSKSLENPCFQVPKLLRLIPCPFFMKWIPHRININTRIGV